MTPITIYESTLPKLGFQLNSWRSKNTCICIPVTRRKSHPNPSDIPLYPFPVSTERQTFQVEAAGLNANLEIDNISCSSIDMVFGILPGSFYDCIMPETIQSLWGPIPLGMRPNHPCTIKMLMYPDRDLDHNWDWEGALKMLNGVYFIILFFDVCNNKYI